MWQAIETALLDIRPATSLGEKRTLDHKFESKALAEEDIARVHVAVDKFALMQQL